MLKRGEPWHRRSVSAPRCMLDTRGRGLLSRPLLLAHGHTLVVVLHLAARAATAVEVETLQGSVAGALDGLTVEPCDVLALHLVAPGLVCGDALGCDLDAGGRVLHVLAAAVVDLKVPHGLIGVTVHRQTVQVLEGLTHGEAAASRTGGGTELHLELVVLDAVVLGLAVLAVGATMLHVPALHEALAALALV